MAIIKMKKLTAFVLKSDTDKLLRSLHKVGAVQISQVPFSEGDKFAPVEADDELVRLENELTDVRFAIGVLQKHDHSKKPSYLTPKPAISIDGLDAYSAREDEVNGVINEVRGIEERLNSLKQKQSRLQTQIAQLEPFAGMSVPVEYLGKKRASRSACGFLSKDVIESAKKLPDEFDGLAYLETLDALDEAEFIPVAIVAEESVAEDYIGKLKELAFSEVRFEGFTGTCAARIGELNEQLTALNAEFDGETKVAEEAVQYLPMLLADEDHLQNDIAREEQHLKFGATENVNIINGWIRRYDEEKVRKIFESVTDIYELTFSDPDDEEEVPTCVETNRIATPFQVVTEMYDTPSYREMDASAILSPFYFVFFGMMLSDAAYGIILSLGMAIVLAKKKPPKGSMSRKVMSTLMLCGISTFIWGAMFGSWFGEQFFPAIMFVPTEGSGPILMMVLCFGVGILHLLYSLIMGMILCFRRKDYAGAICDRFSWFLVLVSVPVLAISVLTGGSMTIGFAIMIAGFAIVLFTNGRAGKNIFKKIFGGLAGLYDVTSYLSDVLSYARIFGMSLATGVIAHVFNTIGGMLFGNIVGMVFGIAIMIIGNTFNLAINALGSFVHSCRLQYIESFPKFFEGGGVMFRPLAYKLENHRFDEKYPIL